MMLDPLHPPERPAREDAPLPPAPRSGKRKPQARLRATTATAATAATAATVTGAGEAVAVADWASLHGDLARRSSAAPEAGAPVEWRVHDRTHVEFAIDYPLGAEPAEHTWEAYFFVPESFRLHQATYDKKAIYDDLWSYVRYAVPAMPFFRLASLTSGSPLAVVREALVGAGAGGGPAAAALAMRKMRLFACLVRASGLSAVRDVERAAAGSAAAGAVAASSFMATAGAVATGYRRVLAEALSPPRVDALPDEVQVALRWTDEDVSLVLETFCATLGVSLEKRAAGDEGLGEVAEQLAACAVKEARHRRDRGYDSVGSATADGRSAEHFEFRRHLLKRFTASVLWLSLDVRQAAQWILHGLYAVAAAAAMAFALGLSFDRSATSDSFIRYALPIVVAYVIRDRTKALLQLTFSGWISRHFPDRKWSIRDHERDRLVGQVHERAAFLPFRLVPEDVLASRRLTRTHALEEQARPECVLWHQKTVTLGANGGHASGHAGGRAGGHAGGIAPSEFTMLTEIFRLNLHRWLQHTDDPNRKVVFADPEDALVYQVTTRRVYNISVVYRLRSGGAPGKKSGKKGAGGAGSSPWHRIRVVVSRKGIERIDEVC